jgi:hypothetical protein
MWYPWIPKKPLIKYGTLTCCINYQNYIFQSAQSSSSLSGVTFNILVEGKMCMPREIQAGVQGSVLSITLYNLNK